MHDLTHPDGRDTGQVLKASRSTVTSGWLIEMEWEWVVGERLCVLLNVYPTTYSSFVESIPSDTGCHLG